MRFFLGLLSVVVFSGVASVEARTPVRKSKPAAAKQVLDWGAHAQAELDATKIEMPALPAGKKPVKTQSVSSATSEITKVSTANDLSRTAAPPATTAATVVAEVETTRSIIERSALRFTFLFEPYQPRGTVTMASNQELEHANLPTSVLGQVDFRWLPLEMGKFLNRDVVFGGYVAGGYARSAVPLIAASGYRYDDVALNTLRFDTGIAVGYALAPNWNLEARLGVGRTFVSQTSRFTEVVGSVNRSFAIGALDLSYHFASRFAVVASVAKRSPIGPGALAFDPLTVSGGLLVQVR